MRKKSAERLSLFYQTIHAFSCLQSLSLSWVAGGVAARDQEARLTPPPVEVRLLVLEQLPDAGLPVRALRAHERQPGEGELAPHACDSVLITSGRHAGSLALAPTA